MFPDACLLPDACFLLDLPDSFQTPSELLPDSFRTPSGLLQTLPPTDALMLPPLDLIWPELFDFYITAIMETWRLTSNYELCTFRTPPDFQMMGRRINAAGESFTVGDSEYADDTGVTFTLSADTDGSRGCPPFGRA